MLKLIKATHRTPGLSPREWQITEAIANGETPAAMAKRLGLSVKTISTYRARILAKTNLFSNAQLALAFHATQEAENHTYKVYRDGNLWCAVGPDFINPQESLISYADTPVEALGSLISQEAFSESNRI